jgi:hypothetical protein
MARIIDNPNGRKMIKLNIDDVLMIVSLYQEKCNCKNYTYDEVRNSLNDRQFYLPVDP